MKRVIVMGAITALMAGCVPYVRPVSTTHASVPETQRNMNSYLSSPAVLTEAEIKAQEQEVVELTGCLTLELDVKQVLEKINAKDKAIATVADDIDRVDLRLSQLYGPSRSSSVQMESFLKLESEKKTLNNSLLSLFRDRTAIHNRYSFLNDDYNRQCKNREFTYRSLTQACQKNAKLSESFYCNLKSK